MFSFLICPCSSRMRAFITDKMTTQHRGMIEDRYGRLAGAHVQVPHVSGPTSPTIQHPMMTGKLMAT